MKKRVAVLLFLLSLLIPTAGSQILGKKADPVKITFWRYGNQSPLLEYYAASVERFNGGKGG